jgi:DnaJ-domain-containing protein 1
MTDFFALLNEARRPWIDPDALKQKFLALSTAVHPDRVHHAAEAERHAAHQRYTELNTAYNCLREPKERLRHLLELERGAKPQDIERIPPDMADSFFEVGKLCREADSFLATKDRTTSPLLKAGMFEEGHERADKLQALQRKINARRDELLSELKAMNPAWEAGGSARTYDRLEEIYRLLGYFGRWSEQLQERLMLLAL